MKVTSKINKIYMLKIAVITIILTLIAIGIGGIIFISAGLLMLVCLPFIFLFALPKHEIDEDGLLSICLSGLIKIHLAWNDVTSIEINKKKVTFHNTSEKRSVPKIFPVNFNQYANSNELIEAVTEHYEAHKNRATSVL